MWLPLQLVLEFLGRAAVWLAVMAALGAVAGLLVALAARRPLRSAWPLLVVCGILGAIAGASLADRFGLPEALDLRVWRRSVPLAWSVGGALFGAAAAWAAAWWRAARRPASPASGPEGDPAPGPDAGS
jgi:hypothetical protein